MRTAPDQSHPPQLPTQSGAASALTPDDFKMIREANARHYAKERARYARKVAAWDRECLASWERA